MKRLNALNCLLVILLTILIPNILEAQKQKKKLRINGRSFDHVLRSNTSVETCENSPWRTIDGTCNNQTAPHKVEWGATDIQLRRVLPAAYGSGDPYNDMGGENRPSARAISNICVAQIEDGESEIDLSALVFTWGQFLDHDIDLTPEGHTEYEPIVLPNNEPLFTTDIHFFRSEIHEGTGVDNQREHTNLITSWIDASNVYGSDEERASWLRTFVDGKLKVSNGNRLPYNTLDGEYESTIDPNAPSMAGADGSNKVFVAGDVRANEQAGLTAMHTLFVREHNRICQQLKSQGMTNDEQMYQIARKWVGAFMQVITYREFLPALGIQINNYNGYKPNKKPDISNLFATAAYRLGHTMVTTEILLRDDDCDEVGEGSLSLIDAFFNNDAIRTYNVSPILKGLAMQRQMEVDNYIVDELRNFLFGGGTFGLDLASLNIQRGRDHGIPDYNTVRQAYGLPSVSSYHQINPNPQVKNALAEAYNDINEIDPWVGLLSEKQLENKSVGTTLNLILKDQFERLRDGDNFYYQKDNWFSSQQKNQIRDTRLSDIIERNTNLTDLANNVFFVDGCNGHNNGPGSGHDGPGGPHGPGGPGGPGNLSDLVIFPNPTNGEFDVWLNDVEGENIQISVFDNKGQEILQKQVANFDGILRESIDLKSLPNGIYFIKVSTNKQSYSQRLIIQKE